MNLPSQKKNCFVPVKARQIKYKFSDPGFTFDLGFADNVPGNHQQYYTNLVCTDIYYNEQTQKEQRDKCGYTTSTWSASTQMEIFELLFPTWKSDACSVFASLPPYQCSTIEAPSIVTATANSLALFNSVLGGLFILGSVMLANGYDVTHLFFKAKKEKDVDGASATASDNGNDVEMKNTSTTTVSNPIGTSAQNASMTPVVTSA